MSSEDGIVGLDYQAWLVELKSRIHRAQQKATLAVNQELVRLYWQIGKDILARQAAQGWGVKVIERLSRDLRSAFPEMKGFSPRNLKYMRALAEAWPDGHFVRSSADQSELSETVSQLDEVIVQAPLAQLPWYHHIALLDKLKTQQDRLWYATQALEHGWSRNVLVMQIESGLRERSGAALNNFKLCLPKPQSDLARESLKDPYRLDFLGLSAEAQERESENALVKHLTGFLLELGAGFAFVGQQVLINVGGDEFFLDLLFYHLKLRCYVVIELKAGPFKPEHTGKLGFYLSAVDAQIKHPDDQPTIGLLLCKGKNSVVAEYALRDSNKPIGVAEYQLVQSLPERLQTNLPTIEEIEAELSGGFETEAET